MTGREKAVAEATSVFQQQIERERIAREQHSLMQIDDEFLEHVLEDSDRAEGNLKIAWHKLKLGV